MEDKRYEKEENIKETEPSEEKKDKTIDKEEWSAVKKSHAEKKPETDEDKKDKKDEVELEVIPEEEIIPVEVTEHDDTPSTKEMMKAAKAQRKVAKREAKQNTKDYEDDGSILKMKPVRNTMSLVYLLLLIAAIGIPVGLLAYTIMAFFI